MVPVVLIGFKERVLVPFPLFQLVGAGNDCGVVDFGILLRIAPIQLLPHMLGQWRDQAGHLPQGWGINLFNFDL